MAKRKKPPQTEEELIDKAIKEGKLTRYAMSRRTIGERELFWALRAEPMPYYPPRKKGKRRKRKPNPNQELIDRLKGGK